MHGANGRVFCISKFAMIQNDFVMLTRRLIRSNTAWLYSFLFHIHRIASASTAFDFLTGKFVPKNHPKQTKTSCLAMSLRSWVLLPMWDFKALKHSWPRAISNTWVSMGHEPLPKFCPQKNRPGKFTWVKVTIGGRSSYVVRSPGTELECFLSRNGGSWQSLRIRNLKAGEICSYFPRNLHQKMSEPGSACSAHLCKSPWMSYLIYYVVFGILWWFGPILLQGRDLVRDLQTYSIDSNSYIED